jgi:hypothetical protein
MPVLAGGTADVTGELPGLVSVRQVPGAAGPGNEAAFAGACTVLKRLLGAAVELDVQLPVVHAGDSALAEPRMMNPVTETGCAHENPPMYVAVRTDLDLSVRTVSDDGQDGTPGACAAHRITTGGGYSPAVRVFSGPAGLGSLTRASPPIPPFNVPRLSRVGESSRASGYAA